jgi:hypothetical protein
VPVGDIALDDLGVETLSVVGDRQYDPVTAPRQARPDGGRTRMLVDIGQQFSCRPVQQLLRIVSEAVA